MYHFVFWELNILILFLSYVVFAFSLNRNE